MEMGILSTRIPAGHPFGKIEIKRHFDKKSIVSRWRKIPYIKKFLSVGKNKSPNLPDTLKKIKECGTDPVNILLYTPTFRDSINCNFEDSWPDECSPELFIANKFCLKYYKQKFFCIDGLCIISIFSEGSERKHNIPRLSTKEHLDTELGDLAVYFHINFSNRESPLKFRDLLPLAFSAIEEHPNDPLCHHALWAICSIYDCSLPIQALLHRRPDLAKHYDFLDWLTTDDIDDDIRDEYLTSPTIDYNPELNFYTKYPDAISTGMTMSLLKKQLDSLSLDVVKSHILSETFDWHAHAKISSMHSQIIRFLKAQAAIQDLINNVYDTLIKRDLQDISEYPKIRDDMLEHLKSIGLAPDISLDQLDTSSFDALLELLNHPDIDKLESLLEVNNPMLKEILEEQASVITSVPDKAHQLLQDYNELSKEPLKNKKAITELLEHIETTTSELVTFIKECDANFITINEKLTERVTALIPPSTPTPTPEEKDADNEIIALLEEEIAELKATITEKDQLIREAKTNIAVPTTTIEVQPADNDAINYFIEQASTQPYDVLKVIETLYPDQVVILPSAFKSAKDADKFMLCDKMYAYLLRLVTTYLPTLLNGKPDTEARTCFGAKAYAANESKTVCGSSKLMKYRTFDYNGEDVVMEQHLVIGTSHDTTKTMRIYFKIIDGKVVIGHAGHHLPTS